MTYIFIFYLNLGFIANLFRGKAGLSFHVSQGKTLAGNFILILLRTKGLLRGLSFLLQCHRFSHTSLCNMTQIYYRTYPQVRNLELGLLSPRLTRLKISVLYWQGLWSSWRLKVLLQAHQAGLTHSYVTEVSVFLAAVIRSPQLAGVLGPLLCTSLHSNHLPPPRLSAESDASCFKDLTWLGQDCRARFSLSQWPEGVNPAPGKCSVYLSIPSYIHSQDNLS